MSTTQSTLTRYRTGDNCGETPVSGENTGAPVKTTVHDNSLCHCIFSRQRTVDRFCARLPPTTTAPLPPPSHDNFLTGDYSGNDTDADHAYPPPHR